MGWRGRICHLVETDERGRFALYKVVDPSFLNWTGLALPGSGRYVIPGGLVPLSVDVGADRGVYREPNVWVAHPI